MLSLLGTVAQNVGSDAGSDDHGTFPVTLLVFFSVLFIYVIAGSAFEHFEVLIEIGINNYKRILDSCIISMSQDLRSCLVVSSASAISFM